MQILELQTNRVDNAIVNIQNKFARDQRERPERVWRRDLAKKKTFG